MTTTTDDLGSFRNSLAETLGSETLTRLSTGEGGRDFLGLEALAGYAVWLLVIFVHAFVSELKKRLKDEAKIGGKKLANALVDALKRAVGNIKLAQPSTVEDQRQVIAATDATLRELAAYPEVKTAIEGAEAVGRQRIVAELKGKGLSEDQATRKAAKFTQKIVSRTLR